MHAHVYRPSGQLSMKVAGVDYCVYFIRKKKTKVYKWVDPDGRNHE